MFMLWQVRLMTTSQLHVLSDLSSNGVVVSVPGSRSRDARHTCAYHKMRSSLGQATLSRLLFDEVAVYTMIIQCVDWIVCHRFVVRIRTLLTMNLRVWSKSRICYSCVSNAASVCCSFVVIATVCKS